MSDSIVLIGFMGAGKTEVGKALAALTGKEFVDTDAMVEQKAGRSVGEIFAAEGETGFRARESQAVVEAAARSSRIIACGGGAVLSLKNFGILRGAGTIVYLRASPDVLRARVGDGRGRPLLEDTRMFDRLLVERAPAYESAADVIVDTDGLSPDEVAESILARVAS